LGQPRATQRKAPRTADDEAALTQDIIALARQYGRYGYRRITALLRDAGRLAERRFLHPAQSGTAKSCLGV
jgi:putative transposase